MATKTAVDQATRDAIHRALPGPKGDQWATAKAIAEVVGKGYSTITEHLRAMVDAGTVGMDRQGRSNVFRKTAASPKLRKSDVTTPRAEPVKATTAGGNRRALATPKRRTAPVTRDLETVELPAADVEPVPGEPVPGEPAEFLVWMAVKRKGLNYHRPGVNNRTMCGRPTHSGVYLPLAEVRETSSLCRSCAVLNAHYLNDPASPQCVTCGRRFAPSEARAGFTTCERCPRPDAVPQPPPAANTPTGGDLGAVVGFMESVRPVSAPPVEPESKPRRVRKPKADAARLAVWKRGELQQAILAHVQGLPAGESATPHQVAKAINSGAGAVSYGLDRLATKGNVTKTSDKPIRYAAV